MVSLTNLLDVFLLLCEINCGFRSVHCTLHSAHSWNCHNKIYITFSICDNLKTTNRIALYIPSILWVFFLFILSLAHGWKITKKKQNHFESFIILLWVLFFFLLFFRPHSEPYTHHMCVPVLPSVCFRDPFHLFLGGISTNSKNVTFCLCFHLLNCCNHMTAKTTNIQYDSIWVELKKKRRGKFR